MIEKLSRKDIQFIIVCVLVGVFSFFFAKQYFREAFPEAAIELKLSKEEGREQAEQFLANRGWDISDHIHGSRFGYHWNEKTILERHFDAETAGRLYNDNVGYYWQYRWFKPGKKEEFNVQLYTTGGMHMFNHVIPDSAYGDSLTRGQAFEKARFYITGTLGFERDEWELMEEKETDRPNRYDYYFEWEEKDFYEKNNLEEETETSHRISIDIRGSEVAKYHEWIKHPEIWEREYANLRSHNGLLGSIGGFFLNLTGLIIVVVILLRTRKKDVRWKTALTYGGVLATLFALNALNRFPETLIWVDSSQSLFTLILSKILYDVILISCVNGFFISLTIAGAEVYYRDQYPAQVAFRNIFTVSGLKTKYFFNSAILGLTLTALFFAYQTLFYLVSNYLGGWSPTEVRNINALGTYIPWVGVLLWGLYPAVSEEGLSRLFSIPFLQKHTKSTFIAVFLSALFWGLAHAGYPAQPFYIRVVEVGLGGIMIGIIFLRFGILPALIWHFTIDAVYGAMILLRSDNAYMFASGLLCAGFFCLPLVYSIISYLKNGGFISSDPLVNALDTEILSEETEKEQDEAIITTDYKPLSLKRRKCGLVLAACSILLFVFMKEENEFDELIDFNTTRQEALSNAIDFLNDQNIDISDFSHVINDEMDIISWSRGVNPGWLAIGGSNLMHTEYIIEHANQDSSQNAAEIIKDVYSNHDTPYQWAVRFYKPGIEKEYKIEVDMRNGAISEYVYTLADTTYVPSIEADSALIIAANELEDKWGFDKSLYSLKEIKSEEKKNEGVIVRTDHEITFQSEEFVGKARYLYWVTVQGNGVDAVHRGIWIPEEWEREYKKPTLFSNISIFYSTLIMMVFATLIFIIVQKFLKTHSVPWKYIVLGGISFVAIEGLDYINDSATFMWGYDTERIIAEHIVSDVLQDYLLNLAFVGFYCTLIVLAVYMMWPGMYNSYLKKNRQPYLSDALTSSFVAVGFIALCGAFKKLVTVIFPNWIPLDSLASWPSDTFYPGFNLFVIILGGAPYWALVAIVLFYMQRRYFSGKGPVLSNLMIIMFFIFFAIGDPTSRVLMLWPEMLVRVFWFVCFLILFRYFCRWNPWSYLLGIGIMWYGVDIISYMQMYTHPSYQLQGWLVIGLIILGYAYLAWEALKSRNSDSLTQAQS